ncbi:uncharacterized protein J3R85_004604 [Psidium guajava]|nr:uncharacterized protein J3R85_004604 [Psidium guajava]
MACLYCLAHLLVLHFTLFTPTRSLSPANTLIFALETQATPHGLLPRASPTDKLPFYHNVTLTISLAVGSPPQRVTMVFDTGSELSWLHCRRSPDLRSVFDPVSSRTYSPVRCSSLACLTRTRDLPTPTSCDQNKLCHTAISYADASSIEGNLASETISVGSSSRAGFLFGCMDSGQSSNKEEDSKTTGLMGMNRGSLSFVTQMGFSKFSYCISGFDSSGILLFGDASFAWLKALSYTPLVQMSTPLPYFDRVAYTVQLEGIKVSDKLLPLPKSVFVPDHTGAGQTMIDSGTQFTFLLGPVYAALKNEFTRQTKGVLRSLEDPNFVFEGAMDTCFLITPNRRGLPGLPRVSLVLRGAEMIVPGERLLYRVPGATRGSNLVYCFTFGNSDLLGLEAFVIGHHHQQNKWMEFDLVKSRVGLADVRCDLASQRLGLTS